MVAGNVPGRRSSRAGRVLVGWSGHTLRAAKWDRKVRFSAGRRKLIGPIGRIGRGGRPARHSQRDRTSHESRATGEWRALRNTVVLSPLQIARPIDCLAWITWEGEPPGEPVLGRGLGRSLALPNVDRQRPDRGGQAAWLLGPVG